MERGNEKKDQGEKKVNKERYKRKVEHRSKGERKE